MATVDGGFANFIPVPRKVFAQVVKIMKGAARDMVADIGLPQSEQARLYSNAKRRALRLLKKDVDTSLSKQHCQIVAYRDNGVAEWQ